MCNDVAEASAEIYREQLDLSAESPQYWTYTRGVLCSESCPRYPQYWTYNRGVFFFSDVAEVYTGLH